MAKGSTSQRAMEPVRQAAGIGVRDMVVVSLFSALTAVGAIFTVPLPFTAVPFSLQVFFVLLAGVVLGSRLGALSQVVYVLVGASGVPVFAGMKGGAGVLLGPTGGYLAGFVAAAYVVGRLTERQERLSYRRLLFVLFLGLGVIYAAGVLWLSRVMSLPVSKAAVLGVAPFLPLDVVKAVAAAGVGLKARQALRILSRGA